MMLLFMVVMLMMMAVLLAMVLVVMLVVMVLVVMPMVMVLVVMVVVITSAQTCMSQRRNGKPIKNLLLNSKRIESLVSKRLHACAQTLS